MNDKQINLLLDMMFKDTQLVVNYPDDASWLDLNRHQVIEVYYLVEVLWNRGGWLQQRPSNVRRGRAKGFVGESTDVQIERIYRRAFDAGKLSHLAYAYARQSLLGYPWEKLSTEQKILYFVLLKRWGLCDETIHST